MAQRLLQDVFGAVALQHLPESPAMKHSLPSSARVRHKRDFQRLRNTQVKLHSRHFLVLLAQSAGAESRIGVTVSTKIDKRAVVRNRIKRRLKELFRTSRHRLKDHFDIVVIARKNAAECTFDDVRREILGALFHGGYLNNS